MTTSTNKNRMHNIIAEKHEDEAIREALKAMSAEITKQGDAPMFGEFLSIHSYYVEPVQDDMANQDRRARESSAFWRSRDALRKAGVDTKKALMWESKLHETDEVGLSDPPLDIYYENFPHLDPEPAPYGKPFTNADNNITMHISNVDPNEPKDLVIIGACWGTATERGPGLVTVSIDSSDDGILDNVEGIQAALEAASIEVAWTSGCNYDLQWSWVMHRWTSVGPSLRKVFNSYIPK